MEKTKKRSVWHFVDNLEGDKVVWIIVLTLILISVVSIFSSTSRLLHAGETRLDMVKNQMFIVALGLGTIILCYCIRSTNFYRSLSKWGFAVSLILLVLLVSRINTPFIKSVELNGARRILEIKGQQFHVFEAVKILMLMYTSWAIDAFKKRELKYPSWLKGKFWHKAMYIYGPLVVVFVLVLMGSVSAALVIGGIIFVLILIGGESFKDLAILLLGGVAVILLCLGIWKISDGKYFERIATAFSRTEGYDKWERLALESSAGTLDFQDAIDRIRQPYSAKIAIHQGGLIGKGPGQSTQRYVVPDISEDYMYSFIIEEYGILGGIIVLLLYISLLARGAIIARNCGSDMFAKLSIAGLTLLITGQAFLHMLVNVDIGPMTGQTLPLISHGNFAFLCFCVAFGIILSISRIAARRIEKEQREAGPLMEVRTEMEHSLRDLDDFESGRSDDLTLDEDYGI